MNTYDYDWIDGHRVEPLVITEDYAITNLHIGTVYVESGTLILDGELNGTLKVSQHAKVQIYGRQIGNVELADGSLVSVNGSITGTTNVEHGGTLIVEENAEVSGTLSNYGTVIIRGVFDGVRDGKGILTIEGHGRIK